MDDIEHLVHTKEAEIREVLANSNDRVEAFERLKKLGLDDENIVEIIKNVFDN